MEEKIHKKRALLIAALIALPSAALILFLLVWNGMLLLNNPSLRRYPVRGVDVSSYQGDIDWDTLASQGISFAFIKATEGSSLVDPCYVQNEERARKTGLRIGSYHFFSFDSPGETQAELFIRTVPKREDALPPVVDFEFYGDKEKNPPDPEETREQLDDFLEAVEQHYGVKPILYATESAYAQYIAGAYESYDIWIRNVVSAPRLSDGRDWTFWQYTNRERLNGYRGREKYIDMNVFRGTEEEFAQYGR